MLKCLLAALLLTAAAALPAAAQARATADGPGSYTQLGFTAAAFTSPYGQRDLGGATLFADAHLYRRTGVEFEARGLRFHQSEGVHQTTCLVGPRFNFYPRTLRPYAKLLAGRGEFYFPFGYAKGSYFVVAAGGGIDWRLGRGRFTVRVLEVEVQDWPGFTFGAIHPYGVSSGIAIRVY